MKLIPGTILFTEAQPAFVPAFAPVPSAPVLPAVMETFTVKGATLKNGVATISGTYACTGANYLEIGVSLSQTVGRLKTVRGSNYYYREIDCDGETKSWSAEVRASEGKYAGGKAVVDVDYFGCGGSCFYDEMTQSVQLKGGSKI